MTSQEQPEHSDDKLETDDSAPVEKDADEVDTAQLDQAQDAIDEAREAVKKVAETESIDTAGSQD